MAPRTLSSRSQKDNLQKSRGWKLLDRMARIRKRAGANSVSPHIHRQLRLLGLHCRAFLGLQKAGVLMPQQYLKQLRTIPLSNGSEITGSSSIPNTDLSLFLSSPHSKSRDTSTSPTKEVSQVDCLPTTLFAFPWPTVPSHHTGISCTSTTVSCPWVRRPGHPSPPAPHAPAMLVSTAAL